MAGLQTEKILLHGQAVNGTKTHRWVIAAFADKAGAGIHAAMLKAAHASGNADHILSLDPNAPKGSDDKPLPLAKMSTSVVPYNPHTRLADGLEDESAPQAK